MLKDNWFVYNDMVELSAQLARQILDSAKESIELNGKFRIVLAGGSSFLTTYEILSKSKSDWNKWHIYIGDERCLQMGDKDRNDYLINEIWLNHVQMSENNIHFIPVELGIEKATLDYRAILKDVPDFDLTLLGMGEDGHTASLFPGRIYTDINQNDVLAEWNSPKPPSNRISMSYLRLNRSKRVFKVVCGHSKKEALYLWANGEDLPINKISGYSEKVFICRDALSV